jgi:hypothetical protein
VIKCSLDVILNWELEQENLPFAFSSAVAMVGTPECYCLFKYLCISLDIGLLESV